MSGELQQCAPGSRDTEAGLRKQIRPPSTDRGRCVYGQRPLVPLVLIACMGRAYRIARLIIQKVARKKFVQWQKQAVLRRLPDERMVYDEQVIPPHQFFNRSI